MRYSIITPTIVRTTLPVLCDSIDRQTNEFWEHLIAVVFVRELLREAKYQIITDRPLVVVPYDNTGIDH